MRVHDIIVDLAVRDIDASRHFYAEFLDLSVEEMNLGWVARFTSPTTGAHLQVVTRDAGGPVNPAVSIKVDDVDAAYEVAQARGYDIVHPLTTEPWGVRRFFVRDPDGTVLNIVQHHG